MLLWAFGSCQFTCFAQPEGAMDGSPIMGLTCMPHLVAGLLSCQKPCHYNHDALAYWPD